MNWALIALVVLAFGAFVLHREVAMGRELVGDAIIIATGANLAFFFYQFAVNGKFYAWEPSKGIALLELFLAILILILGVERTYNDLKLRRGTVP